MNEELFAKYGAERLPRYTSYPTAPNFNLMPDTAKHGNWLSAVDPRKPVSLYFHVPFCRSMCWYCGCHTKITKQDAPIDSYFSAIKREIVQVSEKLGFVAEVGHIHFGGGTPTILGSARFAELMALIRNTFKLVRGSEVAVEIDPRALSSDMAATLGNSETNRASLGIQSFDPLVQKAINRIQTPEQTISAMNALRHEGIGSFNFDLIYGLPHQTVSSCRDTVKKAVAMRPDRFSVFGYAHVPEFKKHQKIICEKDLPDSKSRHWQAEAIAETLVDNGYRQIGLDHFALPDDELSLAQAEGRLHRNFQGYTTDECKTLIGFGASSISQFERGFVQNEVGIGNYTRRMHDNKLATSKVYELAQDDHMRAVIIERLMCDFEVNLQAICEKFDKNYRSLLHQNARLDQLNADGLVEIVDGTLKVKRDARFIVRSVAAAFDAYLGQEGRRFSTAA